MTSTSWAAVEAEDHAAFDAAAEALDGSVIDALLAASPAERVSACDAWLAEHLQVDAPLADWLAREGRVAGYVLARSLRLGVATLPRYGMGVPYLGWELVERFRPLLHAVAARPEGPWLWVEVLTSAAPQKQVIASHLAYAYRVFEARGIAAMRCAIRRRAAHRSQLAGALVRLDAFGLQDALDGLADPALRNTSIDRLSTHVSEVEERLRQLAASASGATKEAAVRLLRTIDARIEATGRRGAGSLAELEVRLRTNPCDLEASRVWADVLAERGDPRGQLVALDHAIDEAPAEHALELSGLRAELFFTHRKAIFAKPGGFPFQDKYLGRRMLQFRSSWRGQLRGSPATRLQRVHAFLQGVTDRTAPRVHLVPPGGADELAPGATRQEGPQDEFERDLLRALGASSMTVSTSSSGPALRFADAEAGRDADLDALVAIVERRAETLALSADFRLLGPETRCVLPYQEAGHYPQPGRDIVSALHLSLGDGRFTLQILFPFESFSDPSFLAVYATVADSLGRIVLTPSGFSLLSPTANGKTLKAKRMPFRR